MTPHEILGWLKVPGFVDGGGGACRGHGERKVFGAVPNKPYRPLGAFSDYVCERLGVDNQRVYDHELSGPELFAVAERAFDAVPSRTWDDLRGPQHSARRRVALVDLVWFLRSLDIAHADDPEYPARKRESRLFAMTRSLADIEGRHPVLSWSDMAIYHPVSDPRTFLPPGEARDQEILMYSVQHASERMFKRVHQWDWAHPTKRMLTELVFDLNAALRALMHYSRVRTVGQFYQLDPYLGDNGEYRGHATGSFSAWTLLMGIFLAGNDSFARRLSDGTNRKAFDRDADPFIDRVAAGTFVPLGSHLAAARLDSGERAELEALHNEARRVFTLFLHSHRGAIKRHAPASFTDPCPTDPALTNRESIRESIDDMAMRPARAKTVDHAGRLPTLTLSG